MSGPTAREEGGTTGRRRRPSGSDAFLALAVLVLIAAAAYPRWERARALAEGARAAESVAAVEAAATAFRNEHGAWPGEEPLDLPAGVDLDGGAFTVRWDRFEAPEAPALEGDADVSQDVTLPPLYLSEEDTLLGGEPPVGGEPVVGGGPVAGQDPAVGTVPLRDILVISVSAQDARILAALLERFGTARSFVREGSWTLVLDGGGRS